MAERVNYRPVDDRGDVQDGACPHVDGVGGREPETPGACVDCVREGTAWVHLRTCQTCGHVGCCDSSPRRHATAHWHASGHPVVTSAEPGESWGWCFPDGIMLVPTGD